MSEQQLARKTAFVTGGTAGIGLAVARAYTNAGAEVVIGGRRDDGEEIARDAGCRFVALDVGNELDVKRALAAAEQLVGPLDVLVLNAGIAQPVVPLEALACNDARSVVEVDLLGVVWGLKHGAARHSGTCMRIGIEGWMVIQGALHRFGIVGKSKSWGDAMFAARAAAPT